MADEHPLPDPHSETDIYKALAQKKDPFWFTIRQQFTLTSLLSILGIISGAGIWINHQNGRILVLETKVIVVEKVSGLGERVSKLEGTSGEHETRINRLENDMQYARTWRPEPGTEPQPLAAPAAPAPIAPVKKRR